MAEWEMFGYVEQGLLLDLGSRRYAFAQHPGKPIARATVALVEDADPTATHWGWIIQGDTQPSLVYPSEDLLRVWFHHSPEGEEKAGYGRMVRLRVQPHGLVRD